ncbi:MAG: hypothetical protein GX927_02480 [Lentisphaerae bacterium]|jgi:hypothetical protein|nr:hypothetical protein [Lentisphaerota bacterium]
MFEAMSLEDVLIIIVLIVPPLILWRNKRACEKYPATIVLRSVPLGCLAMLLIPAIIGSILYFIFNRLEKNPPCSPFVMGAITHLPGVVAGVAIIVYVSARLAKGRQKKPSGCLYPAIFTVFLVIAMFISFCCTVMSWGKEGKGSKAWTAIYLPNIKDMHIAFEQRHSHPFLAEYDYRIRLRQGKENNYFYMWPNTGGRTHINVYRLEDNRMLLKDKDAEYVIDADKRQVFILDVNSEGGTIYAAALTDKPFFSMGGTQDSFFLTLDDGSKVEGMPYEIDLEKREYIGCIMDNTFLSAAEQQEENEHP